MLGDRCTWYYVLRMRKHIISILVDLIQNRSFLLFSFLLFSRVMFGNSKKFPKQRPIKLTKWRVLIYAQIHLIIILPINRKKNT